jgi:hypothetical protein
MITNSIKHIFILGILFSAYSSWAQDLSTKNWLFGDHFELLFTRGDVQINKENPSFGYDRPAVYSHPETGDLMLFFDGANLWNGEKKLIESNIKETNTGGRQTNLLLPGNKALSRFYLFTILNNSSADTINSFTLTYSIIGKTTNSYTIDSLHIPLDSMVAPKITAYPKANEKGHWLISHSFEGDAYYIFNVDETGVVLHNTQHLGYNVPERSEFLNTGTLTFSPNGKYLANTNWQLVQTNPSNEIAPIELFCFDTALGELTSYKVLGNYYNQFGASFSPHSEKLLVSLLDTVEEKEQHFVQYDIASVLNDQDVNPVFINESAIPEYSAVFANKHLQLGLDGRLYFSGNNTNYLYRIDNPDSDAENYTYSRVVYEGEGNDFKPFPNLLADNFKNITIFNNPIADCSNTLVYQVYPNPSESIISIDITTNCFRPYELRLIDSAGKLIASHSVQSANFNVPYFSKLASGVYYLTFTFNSSGARQSPTIYPFKFHKDHFLPSPPPPLPWFVKRHKRTLAPARNY